MRKKLFRITSKTASLILTLWLAGTAPLAARTMYLSTTGDDSAPCAPGSEFRTLPRAFSCLTAGDTLIIRNGTYVGGLIADSIIGTAEAPILIRGESLGAVIKGTDANRDALRLYRSAYITVDRITAREAVRAGIGIIHCDHITVTNSCCADNGKWGILTGFADDVHFEGNECYGSVEEHGIYHSNSGDRFVIRGNILHHNGANGIHLNGDPELQPGDGVLDFGLVERNIIYKNGSKGGAGINMTHVHDVLVRNNLIYDNYAGGFTVYQDTGTFEQGSKRVVIWGNTVYFRRYTGRSCVNVQTTSEKVVIAGNILVSGGINEQVPLYIISEHQNTIVSDYNILWGIDTEKMVFREAGQPISLDQWRSYSGNDLHSAAADPQFVSIDSADFKLAETSPAIDAGMPLDTLKAHLERLGEFEWILARLDSLPNDDILTNKRPAGAGPDAGAYESGADPAELYDFNQDARFNIVDAVSLILLAGKDPENPRFDINADGVYSIVDVIELLLLLAKST